MANEFDLEPHDPMHNFQDHLASYRENYDKILPHVIDLIAKHPSTSNSKYSELVGLIDVLTKSILSNRFATLNKYEKSLEEELLRELNLRK